MLRLKMAAKEKKKNFCFAKIVTWQKLLKKKKHFSDGIFNEIWLKVRKQ